MHKIGSHFFKDFMDNSIKRDIALDIIEELIQKEPLTDDKTVLHQLIVMRDEIYRNNTAVIDDVISSYKNAVKTGDKNGSE